MAIEMAVEATPWRVQLVGIHSEHAISEKRERHVRYVFFAFTANRCNAFVSIPHSCEANKTSLATGPARLARFAYSCALL